MLIIKKNNASRQLLVRGSLYPGPKLCSMLEVGTTAVELDPQALAPARQLAGEGGQFL